MKTAPLSTRLFKTRTRPEPGRVWPVLAIALATFGPWHPVMRCAQRPIAPPAAQAQAAQAAIDNVQKGYRLLAQKSFAAAEAAFRHAIAQDGQLAEAHHGLGVALWREGKNNEALQELTRATQLKPTSAALVLDLAKAAWSLADQAQSDSQTPDSSLAADSYRALAIAAMQKAASLETRNAGTHLSLAELYLEAHQPKEAASQAREAATLEPSNARAFVILGRAELAQGNEIQAATDYERAVQLNPRDGESYMALGELRARQGNYAEAEKALQAAIQSSPKLGPAYAMLGEILERNHQTGAARSVLEQAVALNPDDWESAYQLGKIAAGAGKADQATLLFERALRIRPDFPA
ncbi:MAG: tetratricopeptide repeat protein, partial [Pseudomonadota bacterium]